MNSINSMSHEKRVLFFEDFGIEYEIALYYPGEPPQKNLAGRAGASNSKHGRN